MNVKLRIGLVGARRGRSLVDGFHAVSDCEVTAICDLLPERTNQVADELGVTHRFDDYEQMLDSGTVNAVVVATPQNLHAPQAVAALRRGFHVLSEVPAATDLMQCCDLVDAVRDSGATYMISENCCFFLPNVLVRCMAEAGVFGELYFAEGEYTHDLKELCEVTPWRRRWQTGRNGLTYPTHQLGPVLQWTRQRVTSVRCLGSGNHYADPRGDVYEQEDVLLMLCRTDSGGLIKIRQDLLSNRPHITVAYSLQGTEGCYESSRSNLETDKVWIKGRAADAATWQPLMDFADEFLPEELKNPPAEVASAGHGGSDYWVARDFALTVREGRQLDLDLYFAMDITVPGLVSEDSLRHDGAPVPVPNFREYTSGSKTIPAARCG